MLTKKEIRILELRKKGLKQVEIAKKLRISQPAVSFFEKSISRKIKDSVRLLELVKELDVDVSKIKEVANGKK